MKCRLGWSALGIIPCFAWWFFVVLSENTICTVMLTGFGFIVLLCLTWVIILSLLLADISFFFDFRNHLRLVQVHRQNQPKIPHNAFHYIDTSLKCTHLTKLSYAYASHQLIVSQHVVGI